MFQHYKFFLVGAKAGCTSTCTHVHTHCLWCVSAISGCHSSPPSHGLIVPRQTAQGESGASRHKVEGPPLCLALWFLPRLVSSRRLQALASASCYFPLLPVFCLGDHVLNNNILNHRREQFFSERPHFLLSLCSSQTNLFPWKGKSTWAMWMGHLHHSLLDLLMTGAGEMERAAATSSQR